MLYAVELREYKVKLDTQVLPERESLSSLLPLSEPQLFSRPVVAASHLKYSGIPDLFTGTYLT